MSGTFSATSGTFILPEEGTIFLLLSLLRHIISNPQDDKTIKAVQDFLQESLSAPTLFDFSLVQPHDLPYLLERASRNIKDICAHR